MKNKKINIFLIMFSLIFSVLSLCFFSQINKSNVIAETTGESVVEFDFGNNQPFNIYKNESWQGYATIQEAYNACGLNDTIVITRDCTISDNLTIANNKSITLVSGSAQGATLKVSTEFINNNSTGTNNGVITVSGVLNFGSNSIEYNGCKITMLTLDGNSNNNSNKIYRFVCVNNGGTLNMHKNSKITNFTMEQRKEESGGFQSGAIIYTISTDINGSRSAGVFNFDGGEIVGNRTLKNAHLICALGDVNLTNNAYIGKNLCKSLDEEEDGGVAKFQTAISIRVWGALKIDGNTLITELDCSNVIYCYQSTNFNICEKTTTQGVFVPRIINNNPSSNTIGIVNARNENRDKAQAVLTGGIIKNNLTAGSYEVHYTDNITQSGTNLVYCESKIQIGGNVVLSSLRVNDIRKTSNSVGQIKKGYSSVEIISPLTQDGILNIYVTPTFVERSTTRDTISKYLTTTLLSFADGCDVCLDKIYCDLEDYTFVNKSGKEYCLEKIADADKKTVTYYAQGGDGESLFKKYIDVNASSTSVQTYKTGDILAIPADMNKTGFSFAGWFKTADDIADDNKNTLTQMGDENLVLYAGYKEAEYEISIKVNENGCVSYSQNNVPNTTPITNKTEIFNLKHNDSLAIMFVPNKGYAVDTIIMDGISYSKYLLEENGEPTNIIDDNFKNFINNGCTFTNIEESHTIEVTFKIATFNITAVYNETYGNVEVEGVVDIYDNFEGTALKYFSVERKMDEAVNFKITDTQEHYHLEQIIIIADKDVREKIISFNAEDLNLTDNVFVFNESEFDSNLNVTQDLIIEFVFSIDTFSISFSNNGNGVVKADGTIVTQSVKKDYGSSLSLEFVANSGYHIKSIIIDEGMPSEQEIYVYSGTGALDYITYNSYVISLVEKAYTINVEFEVNTYKLKIKSNLWGGCKIIASYVDEGGEKQQCIYVENENQEYEITVDANKNIVFDIIDFNVDGFEKFVLESIIKNGVKEFNLNKNEIIENGYLISNIDKDYTLEFIFADKTFNITILIDGNGRINSYYSDNIVKKTDSEVVFKVKYGSDLSFELVSGENSTLKEVYIDGEAQEDIENFMEFSYIVKDSTIKFVLYDKPFFLTKQGIIIMISIASVILLIIIIALISKLIQKRRMNEMMGDSMSSYKAQYGKLNNSEVKQDIKTEKPNNLKADNINNNDKKLSVEDIINNTKQTPSQPKPSNDDWLNELLKKVDENNKNKK